MLMLRAAGMFLVALGCIWGLQGLGVLGWPADSFMLGEREWAFRGGAMVLSGAILIGLPRLLGRG
ncbi:hypothetical protein [Porphyrobacter sp. AAP82]|uniref:hypothetical protein n=1 Tax=Porphyrobacter sp. AAP82 TaxID=1248917 RepID=UPI000380622E|nr:hypothetical protein [Porphyrobacter sp. AAP82]